MAHPIPDTCFFCHEAFERGEDRLTVASNVDEVVNGAKTGRLLRAELPGKYHWRCMNYAPHPANHQAA